MVGLKGRELRTHKKELRHEGQWKLVNVKKALQSLIIALQAGSGQRARKHCRAIFIFLRETQKHFCCRAQADQLTKLAIESKRAEEKIESSLTRGRSQDEEIYAAHFVTRANRLRGRGMGKN